MLLPLQVVVVLLAKRYEHGGEHGGVAHMVVIVIVHGVGCSLPLRGLLLHVVMLMLAVSVLAVGLLLLELFGCCMLLCRLGRFALLHGSAVHATASNLAACIYPCCGARTTTVCLYAWLRVAVCLL